MTFEVERAELRDVEFKVRPNHVCRREIRIDSDLLQSFNGFAVVSIKPYE